MGTSRSGAPGPGGDALLAGGRVGQQGRAQG